MLDCYQQRSVYDVSVKFTSRLVRTAPYITLFICNSFITRLVCPVARLNEVTCGTWHDMFTVGIASGGDGPCSICWPRHSRCLGCDCKIDSYKLASAARESSNGTVLRPRNCGRVPRVPRLSTRPWVSVAAVVIAAVACLSSVVTQGSVYLVTIGHAPISHSQTWCSHST